MTIDAVWVVSGATQADRDTKTEAENDTITARTTDDAVHHGKVSRVGRVCVVI